MARERDGGAAVVDFVLVSVLLVLLLFAVLQVAVYFYARNIVAASTADAARYAATAGATAGPARARALMSAGLASSVTRNVGCRAADDRDPASGLPVTTVRCTGRMQAFLVSLPLPLTLDATSSALTEGRR